MKNKKNFVFALSVFSVYAAAVILFAVSLVLEFSKGSSRAGDRFNSITKDVSRISRSHTPRDKEFYDEIIDSLGNVADICGLQIKYGNELVISYPKSLNENTNTNTSLVTSRSTNLSTDSGVNITVTAAIYLLKPSSVFNKARIAFFFVLAATLGAGAWLMVSMKDSVPENKAEEKDETPDSYGDGNMETPENIDEPEEIVEEEESIEPEEDVGSEDDFQNEADEEDEFSDSGVEPEDDTENFEDTVTEVQDDEDVLSFLDEKPVQDHEITVFEEDAAEEPKGLFSPDTGFGWEEYMLPRLESELVRSASTDQDLSLIVIKIDEIDWESENGKKACSLILETMQFNDFIFNRGKNGVYAIVQNISTDKAFVKAEKLLQELKAVFEGDEKKICIGISNRSLRLISGQRLLKEAEAALDHAEKDDDSPVIAYKVDPEKYRNHLASASFQPEVPIADTMTAVSNHGEETIEPHAEEESGEEPLPEMRLDETEPMPDEDMSDVTDEFSITEKDFGSSEKEELSESNAIFVSSEPVNEPENDEPETEPVNEEVPDMPEEEQEPEPEPEMTYDQEIAFNMADESGYSEDDEDFSVPDEEQEVNEEADHAVSESDGEPVIEEDAFAIEEEPEEEKVQA